MKKILPAILVLSILSSCDLLDSDKESTEEQLLQKCLESISTKPRINVSKYFLENGQKIKYNALNGRIPVFIENKPNVSRINFEFTAALDHNFGLAYPISGTISTINNGGNPLGIEMTDSVYNGVNSVPGNSWIHLDLITSTTNTNYTLKVQCECDNGATSPETIMVFKSVGVEEIHQGLSLMSEVTQGKLKTDVYPLSTGHQLVNYLSSEIKLYAISTKKDSQGKVLHQYRYDFTDPIFNREGSLKSFTEITNLPESDRYGNTHMINTEVFAVEAKTNKPIIRRPYSVQWPQLMR